MALFDPDRHEPLTDARWDEGVARAAIARIASEAHRAFGGEARLWPIHPLDVSDERPEVLTPLYYGAAGVIWGLDRLARDGLAEAGPGYTGVLESLADRTEADALRLSGQQRPSYLMGRAGILLLQQRLAPSPAATAQLAEAIDACRPKISDGFHWGAGGAILPALFMLSETADPIWRDLALAIAGDLWATMTFDATVCAHVWRQDLYGHRDCQLGALHGLAGHGLALLALGEDFPHRAELVERLRATLAATALREDGLANWPLTAGPTDRPSGAALRLQHCTGAPGMINGLAGLPPEPETDALFLAAGEAIWAAGPIAKLPGLCHGVPGSGYALLKLHARTGDARWLDRARRFAAHAIGQAERAKAEHGQRKWSLWTGDLGLAVYLADCIAARPHFPMLDVF